jgi:hypothetical protein
MSDKVFKAKDIKNFRRYLVIEVYGGEDSYMCFTDDIQPYMNDEREGLIYLDPEELDFECELTAYASEVRVIIDFGEDGSKGLDFNDIQKFIGG